jgi:hypothetical protein
MTGDRAQSKASKLRTSMTGDRAQVVKQVKAIEPRVKQVN